VRRVCRIRVDKKQPSAVGLPRQLVTGKRLAGPVGGEGLSLEKFDTAIRGGHLTDDGARPVFGIIVQHQHLEAGVVLLLQGFQAGADIAFFIPRRNQHGDKGGRPGDFTAHGRRPEVP